jgi:hypothetical protein
VKAHHLAGRTDRADWQVWISPGPRPLIRKVVITYPLRSGNPQYEAVFKKCALSVPVSNADFKYDVPTSAKRIELSPEVDAPVSPGFDLD